MQEESFLDQLLYALALPWGFFLQCDRSVQISIVAVFLLAIICSFLAVFAPKTAEKLSDMMRE